MQNPVLRQMCSFHFNIPLLAPLNGLQALLPPGFTAGPSAGDASLSVVGLAFGVHTRFTLNGVAHGPFLNSLISAPGTTNTALGRLETVVLASFISDAAARDAFNSINGPNTSRLPLAYESEIEEESGQFSIEVTIELPTSGPPGRSRLRASAKVPLTAMTTRVAGQPQPGTTPPPMPLRSTDGVTAHGARWTAIQADGAALPSGAASAQVQVPASTLHLPAGTLQFVRINDQNTPLGMVGVRNNAEIFSANA
jgi:hypothetical protein